MLEPRPLRLVVDGGSLVTAWWLLGGCLAPGWVRPLSLDLSSVARMDGKHGQWAGIAGMTEGMDSRHG